MGFAIILFILLTAIAIAIVIVISLTIYQDIKEKEEEKIEAIRQRLDEIIDRRQYQIAVDFAKEYPQGIIFSTKEEIPEKWRKSHYLTITYVLDKENRVVGYKVMKNF